MKARILSVAGAVALAASASLNAQVLPSYQTDNAWYTDAATRLQERTQKQTSSSAKNVILFVGDGMGISTLTASRIYQGQLNGMNGEEGYLSFERFPETALVKTYNVDAQTPDSAGTMTAMMSGIKSDPFLAKMINMGFVSHGASGFYNTDGQLLEGQSGHRH